MEESRWVKVEKGWPREASKRKRSLTTAGRDRVDETRVISLTYRVGAIFDPSLFFRLCQLFLHGQDCLSSVFFTGIWCWVTVTGSKRAPWPIFSPLTVVRLSLEFFNF